MVYWQCGLSLLTSTNQKYWSSKSSGPKVGDVFPGRLKEAKGPWEGGSDEVPVSQALRDASSLFWEGRGEKGGGDSRLFAGSLCVRRKSGTLSNPEGLADLFEFRGRPI